MLRIKWLSIGILFAFAAVGALWIWLKVLHPNEVGRSLSDALEDKLHARPTVYLRKYVVVEEKKPIAELALVSRQTDVEHHIQRVLLGSRAELGLRAAFNVKAGFDLRGAQFAVSLDPGLKKARLELPSPRVLSMEMIHYEVLTDRSGWWNRIDEPEKELAMRDMQADAKLEAIKSGILGDCKQALEKELADISRRTGVELEYHYVMPGDTGSISLEPSDSKGSK
jgi:hypothetical protein